MTDDGDWIEATDDDQPSMADCRRTYRGFTVTCDRCGTGRVVLEHTLELSSQSSENAGPWSRVCLHCLRCGAQFEQSVR